MRKVCQTCKSCRRCSSRHYYTLEGTPGQGGKNSFSIKLTIISNESGIQSGNGKVIITHLK